MYSLCHAFKHCFLPPANFTFVFIRVTSRYTVVVLIIAHIQLDSKNLQQSQVQGTLIILSLGHTIRHSCTLPVIKQCSVLLLNTQALMWDALRLQYPYTSCSTNTISHCKPLMRFRCQIMTACFCFRQQTTVTSSILGNNLIMKNPLQFPW